MSSKFPLHQQIIASLEAREETKQWEVLIANLLHKLELDPTVRQQAVDDYEELAEHVSKKLDIPRHDVHIFPQGSMRTQTTISQRHPVKFDLDLVVELTGPKYTTPDPEKMFADFGKALEGMEDVTGEPEQKRRCWRLGYPTKPYYFDLTPAVKDQTGCSGSSLSVRDPDTRWAPSNPKEFADWFCVHADRRFPFQHRIVKGSLDEKAKVTPLPEGEVGLNDILRRTIQLMKLHRDYGYYGQLEDKKAVMPISVIIVTLATRAYELLLETRNMEFHSQIEVVLAIVELMPQFIMGTTNQWRVENPALAGENFADKWNHDKGARHATFLKWLSNLETDLEALLYQSSRAPSDDAIRRVFGPAGLDAWKASKPKANVLGGLIGSAAGMRKQNPSSVPRSGSSNTLG